MPDSDCTLRSISFTPSALSEVCWSWKWEQNEEVLSSLVGHTHIVVLYQDGDGAGDGLEWKEHIGGFLGDFYSDPGCTVCCLPPRVLSPKHSIIIERVMGIAECGAKGESDGG